LERIKSIESDKNKAEHEVYTLKEAITAKKAESDRETRNKERLERELKDARASIDQKTLENRSKQEALARAKEEMSKLEHMLREQKTVIEKTSKEQEHLQAKAAKLQQDYEEQILNTNQLLAENQSKSAELRLREEDISKIKDEIKMVNRVKDNLSKKIKILEEEKHDAEIERDELKVLLSQFFYYGESKLINIRQSVIHMNVKWKLCANNWTAIDVSWKN
jgi:chromosome segregation ATPase